jgi:hypothetical protein
MFFEFWETLDEELAKQWSVQELGPALVFWLGGLLCYVWNQKALGGWAQITGWITELDHPVAYAALLVAVLLLLVASSTVVAWLQLPMLRLAEGYLPWPLRGAQHWLASLWQTPLNKRRKRWEALQKISAPLRTARQKAEYARLDALRARYPADERNLLPFPLGNLLRAAEEYPYVRYGLVTEVCWPRLWLLLPQEMQTTISLARQRLDRAAQLAIWGLFFCVWSVWAWWVVLVALGIVVAAYWAMMQAASVYVDLLRAAFDVQRFALYVALRLPVPATSSEERALGETLSEYLFRGLPGAGIQFISPTDDST